MMIDAMVNKGNILVNHAMVILIQLLHCGTPKRYCKLGNITPTKKGVW